MTPSRRVKARRTPPRPPPRNRRSRACARRGPPVATKPRTTLPSAPSSRRRARRRRFASTAPTCRTPTSPADPATRPARTAKIRTTRRRTALALPRNGASRPLRLPATPTTPPDLPPTVPRRTATRRTATARTATARTTTPRARAPAPSRTTRSGTATRPQLTADRPTDRSRASRHASHAWEAATAARTGPGLSPRGRDPFALVLLDRTHPVGSAQNAGERGAYVPSLLGVCRGQVGKLPWHVHEPAAQVLPQPL